MNEQTTEKRRLFESPAMREATGETIRPGGFLLTDRALEYCSLAPGAKVLDVGCGSGASVEYLARTQHLSAVGVDPSEFLLDLGRRKHPGITLLQGLGENLPFADGEMAAAFAECTLSLMDSELALPEMNRVLADQGYLVITDVYGRNPQGLAELQALGADSCLRGAHDREVLETDLAANGFEVLIWEDHTNLLKQLMFDIIMTHGSMAAFWLRTSSCTLDPETAVQAMRRAKLGYFLLVARKRGSRGRNDVRGEKRQAGPQRDGETGTFAARTAEAGDKMEGRTAEGRTGEYRTGEYRTGASQAGEHRTGESQSAGCKSQEHCTPEGRLGRLVLGQTESVCPHCLERIPAQRVAEEDRVYLEKTCPEHGLTRTQIWDGLPAWKDWERPKTPTQPKVCFTEVKRGCPFDCGLCREHRQHTCTALLEVTARCNLRCSFCFADSGTGTTGPDPSLAKIQSWYEAVLAASGSCNIQLSGGEPTVRDDLPEIIALGRSLGFQFIQVNTNGLRLAEKAEYAKSLKDAGLNSVFLQFDGTNDQIYQRLRGRELLAEKMRAVENCVQAGIGVVLVPTLVPGVNSEELGALIRFALQHVPGVRGVHFQPVSYFGRHPGVPPDENRLTIPWVLRALERQTAGLVKSSDFGPPGCEHAFCSFHGNFLVQPNGSLKKAVRKTSCCGSDSEAPETAEEGSRKSKAFVARQWNGLQTGLPRRKEAGLNDPIAASWDRLLERLTTTSFSISGMAFQDAWNLDLERVRECCIHVVSPAGHLIPFCAYNLTDSQGRALYRR